MKDNFSVSHSSFLVSIPVIAGSFLGCLLAAFFQQQALTSVLIFVFLLASTSRLWAFGSARKIGLSITDPMRGIFPGEEAVVEMEIRNEKFLPVIWLEAVFPLTPNLCLIPEGSRPVEAWEKIDFAEQNLSLEQVGAKRFTFLLWYETLRFSLRWKAECRGIYSSAFWRIRTGDGFGLTQVERKLSREDIHQFVVYPRLVPVSSKLFFRNLWNADTGTCGVMEDPTVIRSTRDYMATDSMKRINWRLTARGMPLSVNIYEDILPQNIHFLFDGESFSGPSPHPEEMEDALSILASEIVDLTNRRMHCGLSLCRGKETPAIDIFDAAEPEALLRALAAYQPMRQKRDPTDLSQILIQQPVFHEDAVCQAARQTGRFYYIAYSIDSLETRSLLHRLDPDITSILTWQEARPFGSFETICMCHLKEGTAHE